MWYNMKQKIYYYRFDNQLKMIQEFYILKNISPSGYSCESFIAQSQVYELYTDNIKEFAFSKKIDKNCNMLIIENNNDKFNADMENKGLTRKLFVIKQFPFEYAISKISFDPFFINCVEGQLLEPDYLKIKIRKLKKLLKKD